MATQMLLSFAAPCMQTVLGSSLGCAPLSLLVVLGEMLISLLLLDTEVTVSETCHVPAGRRLLRGMRLHLVATGRQGVTEHWGFYGRNTEAICGYYYATTGLLLLWYF